ncbi:MAG: hypothetical protein WD355_05245 [Balneolaceae bacterium]
MSISNIIRLLFFPTILLLTILAGIRVRSDLNDIITHGFDKKLIAVSSTTGAFVDLEDHHLVFTPRTMTALDIGPDGELFALTGDLDITTLSPDGSASLSPMFNAGFPTRQLAISGESVFLSDSVGNRLTRYSLEGTLEADLNIDGFTYTTMTWHNPSKTLYLSGAGGELHQVSPEGEWIRSIRTGLTNISDITESPEGGLAAVSADQVIHTINLTGNGEPGTPGIPLTCVSEEDPKAPCPVLSNLAYDAAQEHYWSVGERLYKVLIDGTIDLDFYTYPGYYDHWSSYYLKYSGAMRNILVDQNLTFLYSFALFPEDGSIAYVLDGSVGEDYTHIGYMDYDLPPADFDEAIFVLRTGRNYVSDIQPWGQWGLIKSAFAPIYDSEFNADAIMGADLNVTAISQVTREAMVILRLSTFFFLILSGFAAWFISRPLTAPLVRLKENVLHIAAGFFDKPIDTPPLKDLRPLSGLFNEAGNKLNHEIYESIPAKQTFEQERRFYELMTIVKEQTAGFRTDEIECFISNRPADSTGDICATHSEGTSVVWRLKPVKSPLETLRNHQELIFLVKTLSGQNNLSAQALFDKLEATSGDLDESLFLWHRSLQSIFYRTDTEEVLRLLTEAGVEEKIVSGTDTLSVAPDICDGWRLYLSSADGTKLRIGTPDVEAL